METGSAILVIEMAHSGHGHDDTGRIRSGDHLVIGL